MSQHALIIDDNSDNLRVLARLLDKEGLLHTQVNNPNILHEAIQNIEHIDVVFLDLELPGTDGYEILRIIRETGRFDKTPIIAYTVHVSEIHATHKGGFDGFIGKPLDSEKFPSQLQRILSGEQVWETL